MDQETQSPSVRPGGITLAGVIIGALAGLLSGDVITWFPVALAIGVALGVGIDSLLNHRRVHARAQAEEDA